MGTRISQIAQRELESTHLSEDCHINGHVAQADVTQSYKPENKPFGASFPSQPMRCTLTTNNHKAMTRNNSACQTNSVILPLLNERVPHTDKVTTNSTNEPKWATSVAQASDNGNHEILPASHLPSNLHTSICRKISSGTQNNLGSDQDMLLYNPMDFMHCYQGLHGAHNKNNRVHYQNSKRSSSYPKRELKIATQLRQELEHKPKKIRPPHEGVLRGKRAHSLSK